MKVLTRLCPLLDNEEMELKDFRKWYKNVYCKSEHFKEIRKLCLEWWDQTCPFCGRKAKTAHHFKHGYLWLWKERCDFDVIAVCNKCHAILHDKFPPPIRKQKTINNAIIEYNLNKLKKMSKVKQKLPIDISRNSEQDVSILNQSVNNLHKKKAKLKIINVG